MKIRKCPHKIIVTPNRIKQRLGAVLVEMSLMTANHNLFCFDNSLPQGAGATPAGLSSSHHMNVPFFLTNLTHGITHISRVNDNTVTFMLD
jgi:hypothetical protein